MQTKRACFGQRAVPPRTGIDAVAEKSLALDSDPLSLVRLTSLLSVKQQALRTCCKQLFEGNRQALSNKLSSIWMGRDVTAMKCLVGSAGWLNHIWAKKKKVVILWVNLSCLTTNSAFQFNGKVHEHHRNTHGMSDIIFTLPSGDGSTQHHMQMLSIQKHVPEIDPCRIRSWI